MVKHENIPEGWITTLELANELKKDRATIQKIIDPFLKENPEWL